MRKKIALVLSGGGAKGAFQYMAEKYAREVKGYHWDVIAGVSVGALNATMLAMGKYQRLEDLWQNISNDQIYTGKLNLWALIKIAFGAKSVYSNKPLKRLLHKEFEPEKFKVDLRVGAVSSKVGNTLASGCPIQVLKMPSWPRPQSRLSGTRFTSALNFRIWWMAA